MFDFKAIRPLTIASIKMYFRNSTAIFFTFIFPIIFLVVFGFINSGNSITLNVGYVNQSDTPQSLAFNKAFNQLVQTDDTTDDPQRIFRVDDEVETIEQAQDKLREGDLSAAVYVPPDFGLEGTVTVYVDDANPAFGEVTNNAITNILDSFNTDVNAAVFGQQPVQPYTSTIQGVQSDELDDIDFLVPGIIAFSILSLGVFSITEGFIELKTNGSLRRLKVAPIEPGSFLVAQSLTRLLMTLINVVTMLVIAVLMFNFVMRGDLISFLLVSVFGIILFLGFGYAIAGWAKDGNQAAPVSNIIFFPMMFLSGTFFPRESFPDWLVPITDIMPLTYVADAMRTIANTPGATIADVGGDILGILVWTVIVYAIAIRIFKWE